MTETDRYDIKLIVGVDTDIVYGETNDDGSAVNFTGYDAILKVRDEAGATALFTLTVGSGLTFDALNGQLAINFSHANTALLSPGFNGVYDIILTAPGGKKYRKIYGSVTAVAAIST